MSPLFRSLNKTASEAQLREGLISSSYGGWEDSAPCGLQMESPSALSAVVCPQFLANGLNHMVSYFIRTKKRENRGSLLIRQKLKFYVM